MIGNTFTIIGIVVILSLIVSAFNDLLFILFSNTKNHQRNTKIHDAICNTLGFTLFLCCLAIFIMFLIAMSQTPGV